MYNYNKLLGKIKEVYGTQDEFAKKLGISRTTLSQRLNGKLEFSQSEISNSLILLKIPFSEVEEYFFTLKV